MTKEQKASPSSMEPSLREELAEMKAALKAEEARWVAFQEEARP